ncbi:GNAT family N-acetyltransferase [Inconstantimicrobium mannanitabidum]|uniref:Uncharacterized protein n=1 Tax=Inconstantimicrobium mannanitabidum TaxID=1604901 RepID=A0ACB5RBW6_9CLOT|nr:GNAT family N-acetyltransferase [Clostridium sp. TW13]GKX66657.1 hypothetical protein rsdtw13_19150 [Clostridium sp. TW13]
MSKNVYEQCPIYEKELITLRKTSKEDVEDLLKCYSDEKAVPLFNSDNCNGDDFHYITMERMQKAVDFWEFSYANKYFVRWTVILNNTNEKIGTIEMFHASAEGDFNHYGILRIDLQSKYEIQSIIEDILDVSNEFFYELFGVEVVLTKAIPEASERILALKSSGFKHINRKFRNYDDYYYR